jgi:hypothetical protein
MLRLHVVVSSFVPSRLPLPFWYSSTTIQLAIAPLSQQLSDPIITQTIITPPFIVVSSQQTHPYSSPGSLIPPDHLPTPHRMDPAALTIGLASSSHKIPFKVLTANHDDGEKSKRFGYKAPTLSAWFELFLQDTTPDPIVGILLNLTPTEVQSLKASIHHALRSSIFPQHVNSHIISLQRELLRGRLIEFNKLSKLIRQSTVFVIGLQYPHLFKEPASYQQEWNANEFGCYSRVPYTYRRELLVRLVDICAG